MPSKINMANFIINSKWYAERKEDIIEETERIVTAAAKLIRSEIRETKYSKDFYPSSSHITDRKILRNGYHTFCSC